MKNFTGNPAFPIWLIGDSPPEVWADKLKEEIKKREANIDKAVMNPMYRTSMLEYLNRQYAEDIMNEKYHEDTFDRLIN